LEKIYYNKQLEESKKPPENISKHLKQAFILSLPVLIIGVIELFGIDVHVLPKKIKLKKDNTNI
jgi:hypothetical protein